MRLPLDTQTVKFAAAGSAEPVLDHMWSDWQGHFVVQPCLVRASPLGGSSPWINPEDVGPSIVKGIASQLDRCQKCILGMRLDVLTANSLVEVSRGK
jgi:hypothetical protein